jgi:hypothetical protein
MKFLVLFLVFLMVVLILAGCGKDGDDGLAFIGHDWYGLPWYYNDDNPDTPVIGSEQRGQYYQTQPGRYNFDYKAWNDIHFVGYYEITVNAGERGEFFKSGEKGKDKYYTVWLLEDGPEVIVKETVNDNATFHMEYRRATLK